MERKKGHGYVKQETGVSMLRMNLEVFGIAMKTMNQNKLRGTETSCPNSTVVVLDVFKKMKTETQIQFHINLHVCKVTFIIPSSQ